MGVLKIDDVIETLKENGYKTTEQRRAIVESIYKNNKYVSARDILNQVQKQYPNVSFDTIYRNLAILTELDLIEETQFTGEAKYKPLCVGDHHHHLVCTKCGRITMVPGCPLNSLQNIAGDFEVTGHRFEIYGLCKDCNTN